MTSIVGTTISGRYSIERLLGEGGMGAVYAAEHTLMHKRVAIKVLHAEMSVLPEVVSRFEREAMAASHIEHPNVAAATDFGKLDDGSFFLVLEFVEGKSLREALASSGAFSTPRATHVAKQIASALSRAHGLGIVHRDLKPENVMLVTRDDDPDFVKVLDFGIAKVPVGELAPKSKAGEALTQAGMIYGTPEYMPPEQALGEEVDRRADVYALGVILYEMLVGKRPFDDESKVKLLGKHINAPVPPMPIGQVPADLEALVNKMLAKATSDRVQEARDVIDALDALSTPPPGVVTSAPQIPTSHPSLASLPSLASSSAGHPVVTNPTMLASGAHAKDIFVKGTRDMTRIFPLKVIIASAFAIGVGAFIAISMVVWKGSSHAASSSSSAASNEPKHDARFDTDLKTAEADLAASKWDDAIVHAQALEAIDMSRPEPYRIAFRAHASKGDTKLALSDASAWLDADAKAQTDPQLREFMKTAVASREDEAAAFALLESGKMGAVGADFLYDLAYGASASTTQTRARHALAQKNSTDHATAELRIALDLRNAKDCDAKKNLLDRAAQDGDARALAVLETFNTKGGCGFLGMRDCNACMHKDTALASTLTKLRARQ